MSKLYPIIVKERWGYINAKGEVVVDPIYDYTESFAEGMGVAFANGNAFIIWPDGSATALASDCQTAFVSWSEGAIVLRRGEVEGLIERDGRWIVPPTNLMVSSRTGGCCVIRDKKWREGVVDDLGHIIIPLEYSGISGFSSSCAVSLARRGSEDYQLIDKQGNLIGPHRFRGGYLGSYSQLPVFVADRNGGRIGTVKENGDIQIPFRFLEAEGPIRCEYWGVQDLNEMWGVIDLTGEWILQPQFDWIGQYSNGLFVARDRKSKRYGFVNLRGEWIIRPKYYWAFGFEHGLARVDVDAKSTRGYVDEEGREVWKERRPWKFPW